MSLNTKWQPIAAGYYVDPIALRDAQLAQSAATKGGVVAPFRYGRDPIADCHNLPECEPRVRGYVGGQEEGK